MLSTLAIIVALAIARIFVVQAFAHYCLRALERAIETWPGDKTVRRSTGLGHHLLCLCPDGRIIAYERLWFQLHFFCWERRLHPSDASRLFRIIPVASASIHDLRTWLRCARGVWLSTSERQLIDIVRLRSIDLRAWPDSATNTVDVDCRS